MMGMRKFADATNASSLGNKFRDRRFRMFERLIKPLPRPLRLLDIGGTNQFWEHRGYADDLDFQITLVNIAPQEQMHENIHCLIADATDLAGFEDKAFDVVFSNSVIEHLFTLDAQSAMAREVRRVGEAFWVQTPNYWFPMEPHFHVPGWQWMPEGVRVGLLRRYRCGWRGPCPELEQARQLVREVRLMTKSELARLFPGATIYAERIAGLTKSWVVYHGFAAEALRS